MVLDENQRNALKPKQFGSPKDRKYPMPDRSHAVNAKARAKQQLDKGKLSRAEYNHIIAKANRILERDDHKDDHEDDHKDDHKDDHEGMVVAVGIDEPKGRGEEEAMKKYWKKRKQADGGDEAEEAPMEAPPPPQPKKKERRFSWG